METTLIQTLSIIVDYTFSHVVMSSGLKYRSPIGMEELRLYNSKELTTAIS